MTRTRTVRDAESRAAIIRAKRGSNYNYNLGILTLPDAIKRDGYVAHGARLSVGGIADGRPEQLAGEGWEMIPAERAPDLAHDPLKRDRYQNQNIIHGDIVWMEIPEEILQEKWQYEAKINEEKVRGLDNLKKTTISRGGFDQF